MSAALIGGLGPVELLIILAVVLLLFGGSRLAGIGKSSGRAIREFKEETRAVKEEEAAEKRKTAASGELGTGATSTGISDPVVEARPAAEAKPDELR